VKLGSPPPCSSPFSAARRPHRRLEIAVVGRLAHLATATAFFVLTHQPRFLSHPLRPEPTLAQRSLGRAILPRRGAAYLQVVAGAVIRPSAPASRVARPSVLQRRDLAARRWLAVQLHMVHRHARRDRGARVLGLIALRMLARPAAAPQASRRQ